MKKLVLLLFLLITYLIPYAQNGNAPIKPKVWLRADMIEPNAKQWTDQSGNNLHAALIGSDSLVSKEYINFNSAISFQEDSFRLKIPLNISTASKLTVITVFQTSDANEEFSIWNAVINSEQTLLFSTQRLSSPTGIAQFSGENIMFPIVSTTSQVWEASQKKYEASCFTLGASEEITLPNFKGNIAELIIYDQAISPEENQLLQTYLSLKYGTTFQFSNYVSSQGKVIWDFLNAESFSGVIAGLGRDDGFNLYQKQSGNVEDPNILTVGLHNITQSNTSNLIELKDRNFLVWGMNAEEPIPELSDEEVYPYAHAIMQRKWLMQVNGNDVIKLPSSMRFDISESIGESKLCYLVIDRSASGDFGSEDVEYIKADSISSKGLAYFSNVFWDTNKSGSDMFTLSFGMNNGVSCTSPICYNDATGTINMQIMGGSSPYNFALSNDSISYTKKWSADSRFQHVEKLRPGNYSLRVEDNNGNIATNTISISNAENFTTGLDSSYTLKIGDHLVLNGGANVNTLETTFIWEDKHQYIGNNPEISITQPGEYTLTLMNENECKISQTFEVKPLNNILFNYQLYPNPSKGDYRIDIALADVSNISMNIYNAKGATVNRETRTDDTNYFFSGYLAESGLYFVEIVTDFGKETFKLVIQ